MGSVALDFSKAQPITPPPATQQGSVTLDFSKAQSVNAPDLTSNPKGEGTYKMVGRQGPVSVPYGKVEAAQQAGYMFGGASDLQRYQKDADADPNKDNRNDIQKSFDENTKTSPSEPLLETGLKDVVHVVGQSFVHPVDMLKGLSNFIPADPDLPSSASPTGDQNPVIQQIKNTRDDYRQGGAPYAATRLAGQTFGSAALGAAGGAALDAANAKAAPVSGQNYTPSHAQAFEGAIAPATAMGKNFIPQNVTTEALTPIRSTAARMAQGTPTEQGIVQAATGPKTPPLERIGAYQNIVQGALSDLESQHAPALAQAAKVPVDTAPIVQRLQSQISPTTAPADAAAIKELISRVQQAKTIGDLNTFRQELNVETAPEYKQSQVQAGRSGISSQATSDLAGWVRNAYYDNLQQATGQDFAPLKRQEANLIQTQEALQNQQSPLSKAEATFAAPTTWKETAGNVANVVKDPKTTVTQTFLRESPATKVATLLQKSLDDLPESTTSTPPPAPQSQTGSATPPQPSLGKGPIPTVQATPVNPFPSQGPPRLGDPQGQVESPLQPRSLPSSYFPPRLPAATAGYQSTPVQPNQFATRPTPAPSAGPLPVSPEGQAGVPTSRYLGAGSQQAEWAGAGGEKLAAHIKAYTSFGLSEDDIVNLTQTPLGRSLLMRANSLTPGSAAMKALVKQIPGVLGK
jgi:hypothetical protein